MPGMCAATAPGWCYQSSRHPPRTYRRPMARSRRRSCRRSGCAEHMVQHARAAGEAQNFSENTHRQRVSGSSTMTRSSGRSHGPRRWLWTGSTNSGRSCARTQCGRVLYVRANAPPSLSGLPYALDRAARPGPAPRSCRDGSHARTARPPPRPPPSSSSAPPDNEHERGPPRGHRTAAALRPAPGTRQPGRSAPVVRQPRAAHTDLV